MASTRGFATQKGATARPLESKTKTKSAPIRSQRNSLRQAIKKSLLDVPTTTTTTVATSLAPLHRSSGRVRKSRANPSPSSNLNSSLGSTTPLTRSRAKRTTQPGSSDGGNGGVTSGTKDSVPCGGEQAGAFGAGIGTGGADANLKADAHGIPTSRKGWYHVSAIVAEARDRSGGLTYLVDWEGRDARTGLPWPSTWVVAKNISAATIRAWQDKQKEVQEGIRDTNTKIAI